MIQYSFLWFDMGQVTPAPILFAPVACSFSLNNEFHSIILILLFVALPFYLGTTSLNFLIISLIPEQELNE